MLYIVATPIGNLKDITVRALEVLGAVDCVFAEDTRKAKILFSKYALHAPLYSFHEHNKVKQTKNIIQLLKKGKSIALISEAGTPGVSDPGFYLMRAARACGCAFTAVPGACAAINALVVSAAPTDRFLFFGFLSPKKGKRLRQLKGLSGTDATVVFFESPKKIERTLKEMAPLFNQKRCFLVREMTKVHEEVFEGSCSALIDTIKTKKHIGEVTVVVDNRSKPHNEKIA